MKERSQTLGSSVTKAMHLHNSQKSLLPSQSTTFVSSPAKIPDKEVEIRHKKNKSQINGEREILSSSIDLESKLRTHFSEMKSRK
jgi:hypothetical protein